MATTHIKSLAIAAETSFGSVAAGTGLPDASGLAWVGAAVERSPIMIIGEPVLTERVDARAGPYQSPSEVETVLDSSGVPVQRRKGSVTIDMLVDGIGGATTFTGYGKTPLGLLLATVMAPSEHQAAVADTTLVNTSANIIGHGVAANYTEGGIIATVLNGRGEYSAVTDVGAADVTLSPALSATPANGAVMRILDTYSMANGLGGYGASVALRLDGVGWRCYATGCRVSAATITPSPKIVKVSLTIECSYIYDDNSAASVVAGTNYSDPTYLDGVPNHHLGCYTVISPTPSNGVSAPAALGRTAIETESLAVSLAWTLAPRGASDSIIGVSDLEVADFTADVEIVATPSSAIAQSTLLKRETHSLMLGLGSVAVGQGMAIYLPSAVLKTDPNVGDMGADILRSKYSFSAGRWTGDAGATAPAGTVFRLGLAN